MYRSPYFTYQNDQELMSLFQAIFSLSHDGIYVCDAEGKTLLCNEALLDITNISAQEFQQYNVFELIERGTIPTSAAALALQSRKKENIIIDYPHGKKAILTATPVFDQQDQIFCVVSNVRDITEINLLQRELEETHLLNTEFQERLNRFQEEMAGNYEFIYRSKAMYQVVSMADRFARNDSPIMILGESGVGKDILAQYIHTKSKRSGAFVRINCGAIPEHLLESELFGYDKGAFTGATSMKIGLFELADGGTLFLDEIGELPYSLQVKLLNVLQERQIRRLGGTQAKDLDMRIIAATNSDLQTMMGQKKFRSDLYYRLHVLSITIPPLRERVEDIPALIFYFLQKLGERYGKKLSITTEAMEAFTQYEWPGNVRELKNMVERLYHLSDTNSIGIHLFPQYLKSGASQVSGTAPQLCTVSNLGETPQINHSLKEAVQAFERSYILQALENSSSLKECADRLSIDLSTLVRKKKKLGI